MAQDQEVAKFLLEVTIDVVPVNKYGDKLEHQIGEFKFKTSMTGSLIEVMTKVDNIVTTK